MRNSQFVDILELLESEVTFVQHARTTYVLRVSP